MSFWKRKKLCKECGANISTKDEYCSRCAEELHEERIKIIEQKLMIAAREFKRPKDMEKDREEIKKKIMAHMCGIKYHSREEEMRHDLSKDVDLKDLFLKLDEMRPMLYRLSNKLEDFKGRIDKGSRLDLVRDLVRDTAHDLSKIYDIVIYLLTLE